MSDDPNFLKFWMVYGLGRGAPHYKHWSKESAQNEAKRLASQTPGEIFVVLSAVEAFKAPIAPVEAVKMRKASPAELNDMEIPF